MDWHSGENRDEVPRHWRKYWLGAEGCMVGWQDEMDTGHLPNLESRSEIMLDFTNVFVGLAQA